MFFIVQRESDNARLCRDRRFRTIAQFGERQECVWTFQQPLDALRQVDLSFDDAYVVKVRAGYAMDAYGMQHQINC